MAKVTSRRIFEHFKIVLDSGKVLKFVSTIDNGEKIRYWSGTRGTKVYLTNEELCEMHVAVKEYKSRR